MRAWLTRQRDGKYMLTRFRPVEARVAGTRYTDMYVRAGDAMGWRHMCAEGTLALFGRHLEPMESAPVDISIIPRGEVK